MDKFLYDVFVYNYSIGKTSVKFEKIKHLLRNNDEQVNLTPFYNLIRLGLIDQTDDKRYGLCDSKLFINPTTKFSLGVNLPNSFLDDYKESIVDQYLGLTIFNRCLWSDTPLLSEFIIQSYISQFQSLKQIVKNWYAVDRNYCSQFRILEKFNSTYHNWNTVKSLDEESALYKRYIHNEYYFEYVFVWSGKYYSIKANETEKILFIRLALTKEAQFKYDKSKQTLSMKKGIIVPNFLYKILFIAHVLNNANFPLNNEFKLDLKLVNQILTPLKLIYDLR